MNLNRISAVAAASVIAAASLSPSIVRAADPVAGSLISPAAVTGGGAATGDIAQAGSSLGPTAPAAGDNGSQTGVSANPSNNTTTPPLTQGVSLPNSGPPRVGLFTGVGAVLTNNGIDFHGIAFDHFYANPTAGSVTGQTNNLAVLAPAIDLDLQKIAGIPGGNIHFRLTLFGLRSNIPGIITDAGGFLVGDQTTPSPSTTQAAISVLTYEQRLLNNKLSIEAGRTSMYRYFLLPNSLDQFTYRSSTLGTDGDFPTAPFPVWGGVANYHFTPQWYVQLGAFEANFLRAVNNPDIFGAGFATGAQVLGEVAYRSEFDNATYPANFEAGVEWNTRNGFAAYNNIKGGAVVATPRTEATDYPGGGVLFFQGQKVLWRGANRPDGPPANIALYGAADASFDKPQPIDFDTLAGVNLTGFIPGRPFDAVGIQARYQRLSAIEANYETVTQNRFAGPGPSQSRNGFSFEVAANFQVTPWFQIRPNVQYIVNPDNLINPAQTRRPSDGVVAALTATVSLGRLLGTSNKQF